MLLNRGVYGITPRLAAQAACQRGKVTVASVKGRPANVQVDAFLQEHIRQAQLRRQQEQERLKQQKQVRAS
jgi:hypothetical protein